MLTYPNISLHVVTVVEAALGQVLYMVDVQRYEHCWYGPQLQPIVSAQNSEKQLMLMKR